MRALLALTTRRPRSASGSRPSRNQCPLGTDHEAPAYNQWILPCPLALSARHLVHALGTVYEAPTFSQWVPAQQGQGGRPRAQPWYSGRCFHSRLSKNEFAGIQTATKPVRMRPQVNKSAHQTIDQESEENVFPLQVVPCLRCLKPPSSLLCAFGAACTETLVTTIKGFNASTPGNDGHPLSIQMIGNASTVALPYHRGLEHFVVFLVLFRATLASCGNKTFETVGKLLNEFDSHLISRYGTMHPRHHATLHRRENLYLIDLFSHAIHRVHQQFPNVKLAGAVLNARHYGRSVRVLRLSQRPLSLRGTQLSGRLNGAADSATCVHQTHTSRYVPGRVAR